MDAAHVIFILMITLLTSNNNLDNTMFGFMRFEMIKGYIYIYPCIVFTSETEIVSYYDAHRATRVSY